MNLKCCIFIFGLLLAAGQQVLAVDYLSPGLRDRVETLKSELVTSPSSPVNVTDRLATAWHGSLEVKGATVNSFEATDFFNVDVNQLERDAANPSLVHFLTGSRGDTSSIKLSLSDIKENAHIKFTLKAAPETGAGPPRLRRHQRTPPAEFVLAVSDMKNGTVSQTLLVDVYQDQIILLRVITDGPDDIRFAIDDEGLIQGDYDYVRVKLANDAMSWSSPVWIGGYTPR